MAAIAYYNYGPNETICSCCSGTGTVTIRTNISASNLPSSTTRVVVPLPRKKPKRPWWLGLYRAESQQEPDGLKECAPRRSQPRPRHAGIGTRNFRVQGG
jgi:hypothetical protein